LSVEDARRLIAEFVDYYNTVRLQSAIAYITPADKWPVAPRRSGRRGARIWRWPTPGGEPGPRRRSLLSHRPPGYIEGAWAEDTS
jgi:hypothetical protein